MNGVTNGARAKASRNILAMLFERRSQPARWLLVVAAIPLILVALVGVQYGAFWPYAMLAGVCVLQFGYPTMVGWGICLAIFVGGAIVYAFALAAEIVRVASSQPPRIFLNPTDTAVVVALFAILVLLCAGLLVIKPKRRSVVS
jgi:hypothetical protein